MGGSVGVERATRIPATGWGWREEEHARPRGLPKKEADLRQRLVQAANPSSYYSVALTEKGFLFFLHRKEHLNVGN